MTKEAKITFSIAFILIVGLVVLMSFSPKEAAAPGSAPVNSAYLYSTSSHMTGTSTAKVVVVEFGDYECPACGAAYPFFKQLVATYGSNPNFDFVFRNYPLPMHPNAPIAAEAAEAAGAQGKFWQMHDLLYQNQNDWADSSDPITFFEQYAQEIGLNVPQFTSDVQNDKYADVIAKDQADGNTLGLTWTPSVFINGVLEQPTSDFSDWQSQIDALLKAN